MAATRPDLEITCRGLRCPLPVIYTRKALAPMKPGQVLRVVATDPGSAADIVEFARRSRIELLSLRETAGECVFLLRKK
jgi:tRNA 2-thiouridine synthesizing protein A